MDRRSAELKKFGIPVKFLESIGQVKQLKYRLETPNTSYHYLPKIEHYEILRNLNVIPIYDYGETFCVLVFNDNTYRIIHFELEKDQIYKDYGSHWNLLLMDIMLDYFDSVIEDGLTVDEFQIVGTTLGFSLSVELYSLRNLPIDEYNLRYSEDKKWRAEIAQNIGLNRLD